jgi:hypothetical protein
LAPASAGVLRGALSTTRLQPRLARGKHTRLAPDGSILQSALAHRLGSAALLPLGLDTRRRTVEGRSARGDMGRMTWQKAAGERIDPASSSRVIVSNAAIGSSPTLQRPAAIAVEPSGTLVVVDSERRAVLHIDPLTEARSLVSKLPSAVVLLLRARETLLSRCAALWWLPMRCNSYLGNVLVILSQALVADVRR